ncbi:MAG: hypothetical protein FJY65_03610 [Calditrichaeota bacterium]|nr:hypothetical protein [Calditrichota bacterium]
MNSHRWLIAALLVAWTLVVALSVALYYRSRPPRPPLPMSGLFETGRFCPPQDRPAQGMPFRQRLCDKIEPLSREQHRLTREFFDCLCAETLDSQRVEAIADSLVQIRSQMQRNLYRGMLEMRDNLPCERRRDMYHRMFRKSERYNKTKD